MLQAAEKSQYTNFNLGFLQFRGDRMSDIHHDGKRAVVKACVIGEAFIQLGFVPNGLTPGMLSDALRLIEPDESPLFIETIDGTLTFSNLSEFINCLNGVKGFTGKKRISRLVRKHFTHSLNTVIEVKSDIYRDEYFAIKYE